MTNQEILDAIRQSGKLETYSKEVMRDVLPQLSNREIYNALEWGVEQGQVIASQKSPIGNYVVKPLEVVAEVVAPVVASEPVVEAEAYSEDDNLPEADVEWTASNGQRIQVWTGNRPWLFDVAVDGKFSLAKRIEAVPAKFADAARKNGVIAMLGRVGLTAERKAALQSIDRSGLKCYPVG